MNTYGTSMCAALAAGLLALGAAGCGSRGADETPPAAPDKPLTGDVIDTMTQRSAIEAGRRAADKVKDIRAEENKDFNEAVDAN